MSVKPADCSDGELAALTLTGRHDAFAEIMKRHRDPIYRLIRGYIWDTDEALDLLQDCFVSAFRRLDTYDQARPLRAWLSGIAVNKCRDWGRRRMVRRLLLGTSSMSDAGSVADPTPRADEVAADRQELDRLWAAIAELPGNLKAALLMRTVEGMTQAETAYALRISEKAVETRVYRARKRLSELRDASGEGGNPPSAKR